MKYSHSDVPISTFFQNVAIKYGISDMPIGTFLAPLAEGQRAIVMAWGRRASVRPSVRSSVRASVNFFFKKLLLRNY